MDAEERFRRIFDHSNDAIFLIDLDQERILDANPQASRMLGYAHEELVGMSVSVIHPNELPELRDFAGRVMRDGKGFTSDLTCLTKSSRLLPAEVSASVFHINGKDCLLAMVRDISKRKGAEQALQQQLEMAAHVHQSLLPGPVQHERINFDVRYSPVETVGGDYCQVLFPREPFCYVTISDVAGHGIGPALMAARISSEVRHLVLELAKPQSIVEHINSFMLRHFGDVGLFLTFFAARLDLESRTLTYSGAGHPAPLLLRKGTSEAELLESQNALVGVMESCLGDDPETTIKLSARDRLLFYTDGVTESTDADGRMLGTDGLARIAAEVLCDDCPEMANRIVDRVADFRAGPALDDQTLIVGELR